MAKFFKVVKGEVGGFGNKVHKKGAEVSDEMFPAGNAEDLEKMGVLESIKAPKKKATEPKTETVEETELENDSEDSEDKEENEDPLKGKKASDFTPDEIHQMLNDRNIDFNPLDKKGKLFNLLK